MRSGSIVMVKEEEWWWTQLMVPLWLGLCYTTVSSNNYLMKNEVVTKKRTDGRTEGLMNTPSRRDAWTHLIITRKEKTF